MNSSRTVYRLFTALTVPSGILNAAADWLDQNWKTAGMKMVPYCNWHITIAYFGRCQNEVLNDLSALLANAAHNTGMFEISLKGCGFFGKEADPKIFWLGVEDNNSRLTDLNTRIVAATADMFPALAGQPFKPHLTVARLNNPLDCEQKAKSEKLGLLDFGSWKPRELVLFNSVSTATGVKYKRINAWPFY